MFLSYKKSARMVHDTWVENSEMPRNRVVTIRKIQEIFYTFSFLGKREFCQNPCIVLEANGKTIRLSENKKNLDVGVAESLAHTEGRTLFERLFVL